MIADEHSSLPLAACMITSERSMTLNKEPAEGRGFGYRPAEIDKAVGGSGICSHWRRREGRGAAVTDNTALIKCADIGRRLTVRGLGDVEKPSSDKTSGNDGVHVGIAKKTGSADATQSTGSWLSGQASSFKDDALLMKTDWRRTFQQKSGSRSAKPEHPSLSLQALGFESRRFRPVMYTPADRTSDFAMLNKIWCRVQTVLGISM